MSIMVSVLLPVWNGEEYLSDSIASILNQDYKNLELIVCDDGSTDNTKEIITYYEKRDKRVIGFSQTHSGKVKALNRAFSQSSGEVICLFAHDDVLLPSSVSRRVIEIEKNRNAVVYHNAWICDGQLQVKRLLYPKVKEFKFEAPKDLKTVFRRNFMGGGVCAFSRNIGTKIFPIPEELSFEDWWITFISILNAKFIKYIPEPLCYYRIHGKNDNGAMVINDDVIKKDWRRHDKIYTAFLTYIERTATSLTEKQRLSAMKHIMLNRKVVMNAINGRLSFPGISTLYVLGLKKYILSQFLAKNKVKLLFELKSRLLKK